MALYAVINSDNKAVNFIEADSNENPPEGCFLVKLPLYCSYGYDWVWDGTQLINPVPDTTGY